MFLNLLLFTDKHRLAEVMFNYFDHNYNGRIEKEELWEMQLRESMDKISTLCTLLDIVTFDELGTKDGVLSPDEFIQAFGKSIHVAYTLHRMYGKCSIISNTFLFLFSTKMLVIRDGIHKTFVRTANREDPDQTDLGLHCLSRPF